MVAMPCVPADRADQSTHPGRPVGGPASLVRSSLFGCLGAQRCLVVVAQYLGRVVVHRITPLGSLTGSTLVLKRHGWHRPNAQTAPTRASDRRLGLKEMRSQPLDAAWLRPTVGLDEGATIGPRPGHPQGNGRPPRRSQMAIDASAPRTRRALLAAGLGAVAATMANALGRPDAVDAAKPPVRLDQRKTRPPPRPSLRSMPTPSPPGAASAAGSPGPATPTSGCGAAATRRPGLRQQRLVGRRGRHQRDRYGRQGRVP